MLEFILLVVFLWLTVKAIKICWKLTWGLAKVIVGILVFISLPIFLLCMLVDGWAVSFLPLAVVGFVVLIFKGIA